MGRPVQELLAHQLMRDANVAPGTSCGMDELKKIQNVLPDYDIINYPFQRIHELCRV